MLTPSLQEQINKEFGRELKGKLNENLLLILLYKNYEAALESKASRSFGFRGRKDRLNVKEGVTTRIMSQELSIPQSTIATTVSRLVKRELVTHTKGMPIKTTDAGRELAKEHLRHHRLLEYWLVESLGLAVEEAHEEGLKLMVLVDCKLINKIDQRYEQPKICPCGEEIPASILCN